jgi:flavin reductase (DIM6/NTAB) family NADH-FMN oxidoreductase RutF
MNELMHSDQIYGMKMIQGRAIAALLNPRPVVLVTCCDRAGKPNVLSIAWHTPLSHDPPMLGISVDVRHYSNELISQSGEFVLNVVTHDFQSAVEVCGNYSGRETDKIRNAGLSLQPAYHVRPPSIAGALAHLECAVINQVPAGDHTLFVSRVLYAEAQANCFSESWNPNNGNVLLCLQRDQFVTWS